MCCRKHADRDRNHDGNDRCHDRNQNGRLPNIQNRLQNRLAGYIGLAPVTGQNALYITKILLVNRIVEAQLFLQLVDLLRGVVLALDHGVYGAARDQPHQAKYQRQHNGQRRYQQNRSLNCILNHGILSFLGFVLDMSRRLSIVSTHTISSLWLIRTKEAVYFFVVLLLCA